MPLESDQRNRDLAEHKEALDRLYSEYDFSSNPWGYGQDYIEFTRHAVHLPIASNLLEGSVLDAGGGYGFFRKFTTDRHHVNLDLSPEIMKHDAGAPKVISAVEQLPFEDGAFDNVVCIGVLRHCFDPEQFVAEAFRVLRPGGRLLVSTPASDWPGLFNFTPWSLLTAVSVLERNTARLKRSMSRRTSDEQSTTGTVYDRRYTTQELLDLVSQRFSVQDSGRSGVDFPSSLHPPRWLVRRFYNPQKYGRFLYAICDKPERAK